MGAEDELQAKIEKAEYQGWTLAERKEQTALMKKRSFGSLKAHILIFILTFYTIGIVNVLYALYKYLKPKKLVIEAEYVKAGKSLEEMKEKRKMQEEQSKNTRELMRTMRKFF